MDRRDTYFHYYSYANKDDASNKFAVYISDTHEKKTWPKLRYENHLLVLFIHQSSSCPIDVCYYSFIINSDSLFSLFNAVKKY